MKRAINAIVVDDDNAARNILQKFLEVDNRVVVQGCVSNTHDAMKIIERLVPDVIFLDINMPVEDGLQFAKKLREQKIEVQIIFTTAYKNYAVQAFSINPIDYLVKPFGLHEVLNVLVKVENYLDEKEAEKENQKIWGAQIPDVIKLKTNSGYSFVDPNEIIYIKVVGSNSELVMCSGEKIKVFSILKNIYEEVRNYDFMRINRSVVINLKFVEHIERKTKKCILMCNDLKIEFPITQSVFQHLENMKSIKLG